MHCFSGKRLLGQLTRAALRRGGSPAGFRVVDAEPSVGARWT